MIIGASSGILAAVKMAEQIAPTNIPVLIMGETGTGKELFARHIHSRSGREGDLVCVDCGALPDELAESLLFGHDRGAFTGAVKQSLGLIAEAHLGTLFLDELGSLPIAGQAKLLRVLESGEVRRLGASSTQPAEFRLIATVQDDFPLLLQTGCFRRDLLQRVAGVIIRLPRLDDRAGDTVVLARHFARQAGVSLTPDAVDLLESRSWPGNVRELRWAIARSALFAKSGRIEAQDVQHALELGPQAILSPRNDEADVHERLRHLRAACEKHYGDPKRVATSLGIGRSTLYRWLGEASLNLADFRRVGTADAQSA